MAITVLSKTDSVVRALAKNLTAEDQISIALAIRGYEANRRAPVANSKTRGLIRGGGRKPWRQKGTGRARAGSIRSPLWRGGGTTFGPTNERNFKVSFSSKFKTKALAVALAEQANNSAIYSIDKWPETGKTKELIEILKGNDLPQRLLLVIERSNEQLNRAVRNVSGLELRTAANVSIADVAIADGIVADKASLDILVERAEGKFTAKALPKKGK
ncbi:50S ribosomal protein L4 [Candidatus Berkelbacteria bacterium]|nr:50S ribosomal protein L4 [Candidatus Berkelbacteria bacterium]